ncbi:sugar-binding domain-containing protein [Bifidobacterium sp. ESL0763]|uniref:sugar-binding transcriptional regulator n=1 Tax=Bifidobacterium sp. ESL0763 TaxID=2983227 RepID=UPI0023F6C46C|nr:sugar-binding domain-containing protein [Bifidobacterium sp. ESL0763]MDF7664180.1 sugar-binding domain-containing protein [Bifidobacterium sp. ESL0763]
MGESRSEQSPCVDERVADAAELYWVQGLKAGTVAHELGVSRSTVTRLLAQAREKHIVEFTVNRRNDSNIKLRERLQHTFQVQATVVDTGGIHDLDKRRSMVSDAAVSLLWTLVHSGMVMGITWGRTTESISFKLIPKRVSDIQIVQLHGFGNTMSFGEDYFTQILMRFGNAFDAQVHLLPAPVIFDSEVTREMVWKETSIQQVLKLRKKLDLILTSVGTPFGFKRSPLFSRGVLSQEDFDELNREHVIGDIASTFFREDGSTQGISVNRRATGLRREELLRVPIRMVVAADENKALALRSALNSKLVTHLVVDQLTAAQILGL